MNAWESDLTLMIDVECDKSTSFVSDINQASQPFDLVSVWKSLVDETPFTCSLALVPHDGSDVTDTRIFSVPLRCHHANPFPLPELSPRNHILMLANCYWLVPKENQQIVLPLKFPTQLVEIEDDQDEAFLPVTADMHDAQNLFVHHFYYELKNIVNQGTVAMTDSFNVDACGFTWALRAAVAAVGHASSHVRMTNVIEVTMIGLAIVIVYLLWKVNPPPSYPRTPKSIRFKWDDTANVSPLTTTRARRRSYLLKSTTMNKNNVVTPSSLESVQAYWNGKPSS